MDGCVRAQAAGVVCYGLGLGFVVRFCSLGIAIDVDNFTIIHVDVDVDIARCRGEEEAEGRISFSRDVVVCEGFLDSG